MYNRSRPSSNGFSHFKPPRMTTGSSSTSSAGDQLSQEPTQVEIQTQTQTAKRILIPSYRNPQKRIKLISTVLAQVPRASHTNIDAKPVAGGDGTRLYMVLWRKKTAKKHKTWEGEGIMIVQPNGTATFRCDVSGGDNYREEGRSLSRINTDGIISMGSYDLEVDYEIKDADELAKYKKYCQPSALRTVVLPVSSVSSPSPPTLQQPLETRKIYTSAKYKPVLPTKALPPSLSRVNKKAPLYDPTAENALVMPRPPGLDNDKAIDVVVDPILSRSLRQHQREGVIFLYECVVGIRDFGGNGALLADEMGLGKTLMTISLIWTLLRQSPFVNQGPIVKKVLIACPVTLIGNWKKEFKKWLGTQRVSVLTINGSNSVKADKSSILSFGKTRVYQVLIMGYEKIMTMSLELETVPFDLLVCDEGHRLKNGQGKTLKILNSLNIDKRVLLTGTPIQNDLNEFYNIINFINPGVLGTLAKFQREFMKPILRAREINCSNKQVIEMGEEKSNELIKITKNFTLRRTNSILQDFLPPKTDIILFTPPTKLQLSLFNLLQHSKFYNKALAKNNYNESLSLIMTFRKICNSPSLMANDRLFQDITAIDGNPLDLSKKIASGKIKILVQLLYHIRKLGEKVVLISNFTQTLDILETIIKPQGFTYLRLDGSTQNKNRDKIVAEFNNTTADSSFIFLLSAKSGGVGLNLIGASRLILFDNDWNPAIDLQAMARIHRDGQKKPVFIYRLLTTGSIDEKIFQRQLMKSNLSDKFLDGNNDSKDDLFDYSDLKDLFTLNMETKCNTHDLLECNCLGIGESFEEEEEEEEEEEVRPDSSNQGLDEKNWMSALDFKQLSQDPTKKRNAIKHCLKDYKHINPEKCDDYEDEVLTTIMLDEKNKNLISYMFMQVHKKLNAI